MASFYKEKNKTWTCMYQVPGPDGKMKRMAQRGFPLKKDAKDWYESISTSVHDGSFTDAGKLTVAEWLNTWYETMGASCRPNTLASYKNNIDRHILPAIGAIRIKELRTDHIQKFYNQVLQTPIVRKKAGRKKQSEKRSQPPQDEAFESVATIKYFSPASLERIHCTLNSALKQAVKARLIPYNPCDATIRPEPQEKAMGRCTEDQLASIIQEAAKYDLYMPIVLCGLLGLRRGEALGLRWVDVDFANGLVNINKQVTRNNLTGGIQCADPKTKLSVRTLAIDQILAAELKTHKAKQAARKLELGKVYQDEGFICAEDGGGVITPDRLSIGARKIFDTLSLPDIHLHNLRHTYATILKMRGTSAETLSDLLGHSSIRTTQDFYFRDRHKGETIAPIMASIAFKR